MNTGLSACLRANERSISRNCVFCREIILQCAHTLRFTMLWTSGSSTYHKAGCASEPQICARRLGKSTSNLRGLNNEAVLLPFLEAVFIISMCPNQWELEIAAKKMGGWSVTWLPNCMTVFPALALLIFLTPSFQVLICKYNVDFYVLQERCERWRLHPQTSGGPDQVWRWLFDAHRYLCHSQGTTILMLTIIITNL